MIKKLRIVLFILYTGILIKLCNGEELVKDYEAVLEDKSKNLKYNMNSDEFDMEDAIQNIESLAVISDQMIKVNDLIPKMDTENFYSYMIKAVDRVQKVIKQNDNIYEFMKANGVLRVLSTNLKTTHVKLRTKLLLLLKDIFDVVPVTADAMIPINVIDRLIDIFENDNNLALKAHSLDVLCKWLPNNLQAQARVMKISGLETFYKQIDKLDISVVKMLMELFNTILTEHLDARNNKKQIAEDDGEKLKMYQSIGILEHVGTPKVCNGLLNIFEILWSYNGNETENVKLVLDLVINVKPFCMNFYKKKAKATRLLEALLKFVSNEEMKEYYEKLNVNVTRAALVIEEYLSKETRDLNDEF